MRTYFFAALLCVGIWSAGCTTLNKSIESQNAVVASLHENYSAGRFDAIWLGAHPRLQGEVEREKFSAFLGTVRAKLGNVVSTANTQRQTTTANGKTTVFLVQQTAFEKGRGIETFSIQMEGEKAVLVSYNVQSKLLDAR